MIVEHDMSDRRVLEERLAHLEKMESLGRLASGIAHDFNNLLTAILSYTELLLDACDPNTPDRAAVEEIQKAGQRAATLTQQLLAFSRKQVLCPREVDLNETVIALQSLLARLIREDISLVCNIAATPALVLVDPTQIEQAILNLVLNARDALPGGGSITVDVSHVAAADIIARSPDVVPADSYVRVRVTDNGAGIVPEAMPHLFEPFFTTKDQGKGTGLGLASVHGMVRQSQGWIDVESEPGLGATFSVYLPAVGPAAEPRAAAASASEPAHGDETILLVEDDDAVRRIVSAVLRRHGYTVLESATPAQACEMFARREGQVDLLVSDVVMPGMNGPALAQRLVGLQPSLRVLFISGHAGITTADLGGLNVAILNKPFETTTLAARVREILSSPAREETREEAREEN